MSVNLKRAFLIGENAMKLEGVKVLDLSQFLPGPHLSMTMADHGAEVIMIEIADGFGEPTRNIGEKTKDGVCVWFRNIARGKMSVALDLKAPKDRELFLQLATTADVIIESFRPGVVARLGIDYDTVAARNPGVVYCSISAFGQQGPYRDRPAHDLAIQSLAGTVDLCRGLNDNKPSAPNMPTADITASLTALSAIMMALFRRTKTQTGDYIDIAMYDTLLAWTVNVTGPVFAEERPPEPKHMRSFGGQAMNRIYETGDGQFIVLGGSEAKFARSLLEKLERIDLLEIAALDPGLQQQPLVDFLTETFRSQTREHWEHFLSGIDVCWAPVRTLKDSFSDANAKARGMILYDGQGNRHIGPPIHFRAEPPIPKLEVAAYGQNTEAVAARAGFPTANRVAPSPTSKGT